MNNELQKHKTSDTVKWVLTLIAFILVAVVLTGIILGWFEKKDDKPTETNESEVVVTLPDNSDSGVKLAKTMLTSAQYEDYGISPQAESAFTITATALDASNNAHSIYQYFEWEMRWAGSNSATVSDYVTMTTTERTATFSCNKAFSTQIFVTATSTLDESISATATLDYAKRLTDINFQGVGNVAHVGYVTKVSSVSGILNLPNVDTYSQSGSAWENGKLIFCTDSPVWGTGTVSNSINTSNLSVKVELSPETQAAIKATSGLSFLSFSPITYTGAEVINGISPKALFTELAFSQFNGQVFNHLLVTFMTAFGKCSNQFNVTVSVPCTYGGTQTVSYVLGGTVQGVTLSSMRLSDASHVF